MSFWNVPETSCRSLGHFIEGKWKGGDTTGGCQQQGDGRGNWDKFEKGSHLSCFPISFCDIRQVHGDLPCLCYEQLPRKDVSVGSQNAWDAAEGFGCTGVVTSSMLKGRQRWVEVFKGPGWLFGIGDYATQLFGDYKKPRHPRAFCLSQIFGEQKT